MKNAVQQLYSQVTNVSGNNNTVTINSVDDFIAQYNKLLSENETLKAQNSQYFADYTEQKNINNNLESQLSDRPVVLYKNVGLCIDAEDIPISKNNSIITIDGREYYSKELAEKFLNDNQNITLKDDTLFVGKVIAEKANLIDQWMIDSDGCKIVDSIKDSYGDMHTSALSFTNSSGNIIYNLNKQYSYFKFTIATNDSRRLEDYVTVTIKADDVVVFSQDIDKKTKPITSELPINNCSTLTIQCKDSQKNIYYYCNCFVSDAILYN